MAKITRLNFEIIFEELDRDHYRTVCNVDSQEIRQWITWLHLPAKVKLGVYGQSFRTVKGNPPKAGVMTFGGHFSVPQPNREKVFRALIKAIQAEPSSIQIVTIRHETFEHVCRVFRKRTFQYSV